MRVPNWPVAMWLRQLSRRGLDLDEVVRPLPVTADQLRAANGLIEWEVMVRLVERVLEMGLSIDDLVEGSLAAVHDPVFEGYARMLRHLNPPTSYLFLLRIVNVPFARVLVQKRRALDDGRLEVTLHVEPGHRSHPGIWWAIKGALAGLPTLQGLPPGAVELDLLERGAVYRITLPPHLSRWQGFKRRVAGWVGSGRLFEHYIAQQEQIAQNYEQLAAANQALEAQAEALQESEMRYRSVIENTLDLILVTDLRARVVMVSPSVQKLLDITPEDSRRHVDLFEAVHEDDIESARRFFAEGVRRGECPSIEFRIVGAHGEVYWLDATGRKIKSATGRDQMLIVARDMTERKQAAIEIERDSERLEAEVARRTIELQKANEELRQLQSRLIDAERIGATQELAGSVAHAINNPLAALSGNVELLMEADLEDDPRLGRIMHLAKRIRSVVDRTLQLSREGTLDLSLESPGAILQDVREELETRAGERNVRLAARVGPDIPTIYADRTLLTAALVAVGENAIEASSPGDTVRIEVRMLEGMRVVEFRFEDSGPGIPKEVQDRLFEPFFTTKSAGTGLGLSIAQGVILGHEGRIGFRPGASGGTIASVEIPLYIANRALSDRPHQPPR